MTFFFFCTLYFTLQKVLQSILVSELSRFLCLEVSPLKFLKFPKYPVLFSLSVSFC